MGILDTLANTVGAGRNGASSGSMSMPQGMENYAKMQGVLGTLDDIVKSSSAQQNGILLLEECLLLD